MERRREGDEERKEAVEEDSFVGGKQFLRRILGEARDVAERGNRRSCC